MVALARALQRNPHTLQPMAALRTLACGGKWLVGTAASRSSSAAAFADAILALCEGQTRAQLHPWLNKLTVAEAPPVGWLELSMDRDTQRAIKDALVRHSWREHTLVVNHIQQPHHFHAGGFVSIVREHLELVVARDEHKPRKLRVHMCED
eukprot:COSAG02_NODE_1419_length_12701_cov_20.731551_7_plen_151_part_00